MQVVDATDVWGNDFIKLIPAGQSRTVAVPAQAKGTIEIRYESHGGLRHFYTQPL